MKLKLAQLLGIAVAFLFIAPLSAQAANINTGGNACQGVDRNQPVIVDNIGIRNVSTTDPALITCTVTRSPLAAGATSALFYVDGVLFPGGELACSILSYNYTFDLLGVQAFTTTNSTFDVPVTFPAAQMPTWSYTMLACRLPPQSRILGVTSVQ